MKKITFLLGISILLSGCSLLSQTQNPKSQNPELNEETVWYPKDFDTQELALIGEAPDFESVYQELARTDESCKASFEEYYHNSLADYDDLANPIQYLDLIRTQSGDCAIGFYTTEGGDDFWYVLNIKDPDTEPLFALSCEKTWDEEKQEFHYCDEEEIFANHLLYQQFMVLD